MATEIVESGSVTKIRMRREINLLYSIAIMTGVIIGSGIFVSPVSITQNCGSIGLSLVFWAVTGLITLCMVLCYAELGCCYPRAGGEYAYFREILGPVPAFLNVWIQFVVIKPTFQAILALTTTNYLFYPLYPDCSMPTAANKLVSMWILLTLVVLNSVYVRYVTRVQAFFTVAKVVTLCLIIVVGILQITKGDQNREILQSGFEGTTTEPGNVAVAFVTGVFTYGGWNYLFNLLEEVKKPEKVVPTTAFVSMALVIVLYVLANVAYFSVMSPDDMARSSAVAVTFAEKTVGKASVIVPALVACSTIGAMNAVILGGSRKYFAAARDQLFPEVLATIHIKYLTPWASVWVTFVLASIYIATGDAIRLIEYLGFVDTLVYILSMSCVLYLRIKKPYLHRPFKVPLFLPVLALLVMIAAAVLGLYQRPWENGIGVLILFSGLPAYLLGVAWKQKPSTFRRFTGRTTAAIQKVFLLAPQDA